MKFQTRAIHTGQAPDSQTGAVVTPIITSTTFAQKSPGKHSGYEYSRVSTPTRVALEKCMASLENGTFALAVSSGCSAMNLILQLLKPGDLILAEEDLYGGTLRLLEHTKKTQGIKVMYADLTDKKTLPSLLCKSPQMICLETPTNPLLKIIDIKEDFVVVDINYKSEGLISKSEFRLSKDRDSLKIGQEVEVKIINIQKEAHKLSLSIKQAQENPWEKILDKFSVDQELEAPITSVNDFGLFVNIGEGIDGLVHVSDLSWTENIKPTFGAAVIMSFCLTSLQHYHFE